MSPILETRKSGNRALRWASPAGPWLGDHMAENTLPQVFARLLPLPQLRGRDLTVQEIAMALGVSRRTAFRYLATALDGVERTAI